MNTRTKKIAVLIPCKNEAEGIAEVIKSFPYERAKVLGYSITPIVIDNNSTDHTADVARAVGAVVVTETRPGKGNAMKKGFQSVPSDAVYVAMIDGDNTYHASELLRMIEPLDSGFCNVVIGSRLAGKIEEGSMKLFNRIGNWGFSFIVRMFYRANVTDVLTGYFAWKRDVLMRLVPHITAEGFGLEMDMVTKMARLKEEVYCVPISHAARAGNAKLHPVIDGFRILRVFVQNYFWSPQGVGHTGSAVQVSHQHAHTFTEL